MGRKQRGCPPELGFSEHSVAFAFAKYPSCSRSWTSPAAAYLFQMQVMPGAHAKHTVMTSFALQTAAPKQMHSH
jgi:hypothetical protein